MARWADIAVAAPAATPTKAVDDLTRQTVAVVDANAFISGLRIERLADRAVTIEEVLHEVRDQQARHNLATLPFGVEVREPTEESAKAGAIQGFLNHHILANSVTRFARATGDLHVLSAVDLKLLALMHTLEVAAHGSGHLRELPGAPKTRSKGSNSQGGLPGWGAAGEQWTALDELDEAQAAAAERLLQGAAASHVAVAAQPLTLSRTASGDSRSAEPNPAGPSSAVAAVDQPQEEDDGDEADAASDGEWQVVGKSSNAMRRRRRREHRRAAIAAVLQPGIPTAAQSHGPGEAAPAGPAATPRARLDLQARQARDGGKALQGQMPQNDRAGPAAGDRSASTGERTLEPGPAQERRSLQDLAPSPAQHRAASEVRSVQEQAPAAEQSGRRAGDGPAADVSPSSSSRPADSAEPADDPGGQGNEGRERECGTEQQGGVAEEVGERDAAGSHQEDSCPLDSCPSDDDGPGEDDELGDGEEETGDAQSQAGTSAPTEDFVSRVACVTADFPMQNVILQMGMRLLTPDGRRITRISRWALRCSACFFVTKDAGRVFCGRCGNASLERVEVIVGPDGAEQYGVRKQRVLRGTRYSLPKPKGGKDSKQPILREDVLLQKLARRGGSMPAKKPVGSADPDGPSSPEFGAGARAQGLANVPRRLAAALPSAKHNPNERKLVRTNRRKK